MSIQTVASDMTECFTKMAKTPDKNHEKYLQTLLSYYEDEIVGEGYFYGLVSHFDEREKLTLLARIECRAAASIFPLLKKYELQPGDESDLKMQATGCVKQHASFSWLGLMSHMVKRYPGYLDDFKTLQQMAPDEDLEALNLLTDHEVAVIEFAEKELTGDLDSLTPLREYLAR